MAKRKKEASEIMETYTTEITYNCPVRGKVTEKIEVKKYKATEREYLTEVPAIEIEDENEYASGS